MLVLCDNGTNAVWYLKKHIQLWEGRRANNNSPRCHTDNENDESEAEGQLLRHFLVNFIYGSPFIVFSLFTSDF